jgi:5-methylcytosine-specific restriction endonuclease McrA
VCPIYEKAKRHGLEVDHVRPFSKGGKHCRLNLQLLSKHENRTKHAKWQEAA